MYDFNFFKFIEISFLAQDMSILINALWVLEKSVCCAVVGWSSLHMSIRSFWLIFFYILVEFLSSCSINCQENGIEISNYNRGFVYFFSVLPVFALHISELCCLVGMHLGFLCLLIGLTILSLSNTSLSVPAWYSLLWSLFYLMLIQPLWPCFD